MRPAVVITIAVLLLAILGAAALQFFILAPGDTSFDEEVGAPLPIGVIDVGPSSFVHL